MKKTISTSLLFVSIILITSCGMHPKTLPPGEYTKTEKSTNSAGTQTEKTTNTTVYYDEYGNKRAVQETQTSRDPKGLFNKSTSTSTKTY